MFQDAEMSNISEKEIDDFLQKLVSIEDTTVPRENREKERKCVDSVDYKTKQNVVLEKNTDGVVCLNAGGVLAPIVYGSFPNTLGMELSKHFRGEETVENNRHSKRAYNFILGLAHVAAKHGIDPSAPLDLETVVPYMGENCNDLGLVDNVVANGIKTFQGHGHVDVVIMRSSLIGLFKTVENPFGNHTLSRGFSSKGGGIRISNVRKYFSALVESMEGVKKVYGDKIAYLRLSSRECFFSVRIGV